MKTKDFLLLWRLSEPDRQPGLCRLRIGREHNQTTLVFSSLREQGVALAASTPYLVGMVARLFPLDVSRLTCYEHYPVGFDGRPEESFALVDMDWNGRRLVAARWLPIANDRQVIIDLAGLHTTRKNLLWLTSNSPQDSGLCRLGLVDDREQPGSTVAIVSSPKRVRAVSVTNGFGRIASLVTQAYSLDPAQTRWIEHYPAGSALWPHDTFQWVAPEKGNDGGPCASTRQAMSQADGLAWLAYAREHGQPLDPWLPITDREIRRHLATLPDPSLPKRPTRTKLYVSDGPGRDGGNAVFVHQDDGCYRLKNVDNCHVDNWFAWGYRGTGPTALALSILVDLLGNTALARPHWDAFRDQVIARLDTDGRLVLTQIEIETWLATAADNPLAIDRALMF